MKIFKNKKFVAFVIALQEAFIAIIPFFILTGILALINNIITYYHIRFFYISPDEFKHFLSLMQSFSSIIPVISISYFLAKRIKISEIMSILLSVTTFISVIFYEYNPVHFINFPSGMTSASITMPILSTLLLKYLYPYFSLNITAQDGKTYAFRLFNYIFVFFITYFATMSIYISVDFIMDYLIEHFNPLTLNLPGVVLLIIRNILVQIFWFFGMHGEHMVNALFGKDILFKTMFPNLTYAEFQRIFVSIGGAGAGVALLIAILITTKDKAVKKIALISAPFAVFNIDNILIFLTVVFNRLMFIPFVILPVINILIAYMFIKIFNIHFFNLHFDKYHVVWTTPVFADGYLKTHDITTTFIQLIIISVDIAVYSHFLKRSIQIKSIDNNASILEKNLELDIEIEAKADIKAFQANLELIDANAKVTNTIKSLNKDNLLIYYQPKVDIKNNKTDKFEALLRYNENGKIKGPFFLEIIEKAGLAPIIDIWVCKQVKKDIHSFKNNGLNPKISINLHPDTLKSYDAITKILDILKNENVAFEIIERSFVNKNATANIKRIKNKGYELSIDDYGVGYSSLETLIKQEIDELKLDKSLIDEIETKKGFLICKNTINLCKELKITIVAEGVETKSQLKIVKNLDVDLVQGYVFSPAIPLKKAIEFSKNFNLNEF